MFVGAMYIKPIALIRARVHKIEAAIVGARRADIIKSVDHISAATRQGFS